MLLIFYCTINFPTMLKGYPNMCFLPQKLHFYSQNLINVVRKNIAMNYNEFN